MSKLSKLTSFQIAYIECAFWCSTDSLDARGYGLDDIAAATLQDMVDDCDAFTSANALDLSRAGDDVQNGHDFWVTRNRHGTGFWDRGYGDVGKRLTDAAHVYGESNLYVGADGMIQSCHKDFTGYEPSSAVMKVRSHLRKAN